MICKSWIISRFLDKHSINNIKSIFPFGSRVYGSDSIESDYDFIVVIDEDFESYQIIKDNFTINVYSLNVFISMLNNHSIDALECYFLPPESIIFNNQLYSLEIDKSKLRRAISSVVSNSFVKCKKKLIDGDYLTGIKSMFHSYRILDFGLQISKTGKIYDYSSSNNILELLKNYDDWKIIQDLMKPQINKMSTEFRKLNPL
jgi:predicted nucleotidyltransferase